MLTNNADITVFSSKKIGRETFWVGIQLSGVNFHGSDEVVVSDKSASRSDEYIIRIPDKVLRENNYLDRRTWKSLPIEELRDSFTLQKGDYIVEGHVQTDVTSSGEILKLFDDVSQITHITENLNASPFSKHIKVVIK